MMLLLLFACDVSSEIIIDPKISATLTIQSDDITMKGFFTRNIDGEMEYTITYPEDVSGMRYLYKENMFTVYFHDMERSGDLWQNSPVKIVFGIINTMIAKPIVDSSIMTEKGKCTYITDKNKISEIEVVNITATFEYK